MQNMKNLGAAAVIMAAVYWANQSFGEQISRRNAVKIPSHKEESFGLSGSSRNRSDLEWQNRQLRKRVYQLERAVMQLQTWVIELSRHSHDTLPIPPRDRDWPGTKTQKSKARTKKKRYACLINGRHLGKGATRVEARANAMRVCEKARDFCGKMTMKLECEKAY